MPPNQLLADPSANPGQTARGYLTGLAGQNFASYANWRTSWGQNVPPAGPRHLAGLRQYPAQGGGFPQPVVDTLFVLFTYAVAGRVQWPGDQAGSRIVGVLADDQGRIFGWQVNHRHINATFHAETNLVQAVGQIPAGATLYSTLEPCHQCAGLFVRAGGTRCVYGQNDPNMIGNTALAGLSSRLQQPTLPAGLNPPMSPGDRLDQIRDTASVAAQAAAVARTLDERRNQPILARVQDALANTNYLAIQTRVLNILNTAPSRDLFAESDVCLRTVVGIVRGQYGPDHPQRIFVENIAQALNY
jgi:tRNA(Arg) A34 adenosine deaminase TadA